MRTILVHRDGHETRNFIFQSTNVYVGNNKLCSEADWTRREVNGVTARHMLEDYKEKIEEYQKNKDRLLSLEKSLEEAKANGLKPRFTEETNAFLRNLDKLYDILTIFDRKDAGEATIEMCEAVGYTPQYRFGDDYIDKIPIECEQLGEWLYDAYHSDFKETMERLRDEYDMYLSNDEYYALRGEDGSVLIN